MNICNLPIDILGRILSICGLKSRLALLLVCKSFKIALKEYSAVIDISNLKLSEKKLSRIISQSRYLNDLNLANNYQLTFPDVSKIINQLDYVKSFNFSGVECVNDKLITQLVVKNKDLRSLNLTFCSVGDSVLLSLAKLQKLETLSIRHTSITSPLGFCAFTIPSFTSLTSFDLSLLRTSIDDQSIISIRFFFFNMF
jgi:hypothetical protein